MRINGDIVLKGTHWEQLRSALIEKSGIFTRVVDFFVISASIGVA